MKISEQLKIRNGRTNLSFEIFPPKADADFSTVQTAAQALSRCAPDFMSVTYGAGGGTSKNTVKIASFLQRDCSTLALAHLTCVSSTKEEVARVLDELTENGIENVLALRGDIPAGQDFPNPAHYRYATDLIEEIAKRGGFCIGGACYPETHPNALSPADDIDNLRRKQDAGCSFLITQLFFDNNVFYEFLDRCAAAGVTVPILPGIMPVLNAGQIKRMCALSGASLTPKFSRMVAKYQNDPYAMQQAGVAYATEQITDLLSYNVAGIHLYTMNRPEIAMAIRSNIQFLY